MVKSQLLILNYKFLHNRVHQAAYSLMTPADKQETHFKIGRLLLAQMADPWQDERVFEIVHHLNLSHASKIETPRLSSHTLAELNLIACCKAKANQSYQSAWAYSVYGFGYLGQNNWKTYSDLSLILAKEQLQLAYLSNQLSQVETIAQNIFTHISDAFVQAEVYNILVQQAVLKGQYTQAIIWGRQGLGLLGLHLPLADFEQALAREKAHVALLLQGQNIQYPQDVINLAQLTHTTIPEIEQALTLLLNMEPALFMAKQDLWPIVGLKILNLTLTYGPVPDSAYGYVVYGQLLTGWGQSKMASAFGQLALHLIEQKDSYPNLDRPEQKKEDELV